MTQNQLKYWELRWKQHYEKILAEVKVREVVETERHNRAVEQETARHNRREERIDTQNMIINRMNLDARWAELNEKRRAAMVAEALNEKKYALAVQQELRESQYTKAQINKMLSDVKLASMDMAMSIVNNKHKIATEYLKAEAALFKNGWTKAAAGEVIADVKSLISSSEFDVLLEQLKKDDTFSWIASTYGPGTSSAILGAQQRSVEGNDDGSTANKDTGTTKSQRTSPDFQPYRNEDGTVYGMNQTQDTSGSDSPVKVGTSGSRYYDNHSDAGSTKESIETGGKGSSPVIYSPGSHYGPGYV